MVTSVIYYPGYAQVQVRENLIVRTIAAITQAYPMVVTTDEDHDYVAGMMVRFLIPAQFGMVELNEVTAQVLVASGDSLSVDVDSSTFTPFAFPSPVPSAYTPPTVIPNSSGTYLPPRPLPYGNQDSFEGTIYNAGLAL
jgi:hypothetical protein